MTYVNHYKMVKALLERTPIDPEELLANVRWERIIPALERSKAGVPQKISFTDLPIDEENWAKMSARHKERLQDLAGDVNKAPLEVIPKLLALRKKYPNVPVIQHYLGNAYACSGQEERHYETLMETIERFPTYLFGKASLAEYYLRQDQHRKVKEILDGKFELHQHYPTRKLYHISEVRSFFSVVGTYFARSNNLARSLYHYLILSDVEPEHPVTKRLGYEIVQKEIENLSRKIEQKTNESQKK